MTGGPGADADPATGVPQVAITDAQGIGTINNDEAIIEFEFRSTEEGESGETTDEFPDDPNEDLMNDEGTVSGTPTLIVFGDLTGTSDAERTFTIQFVSGNLVPANGFFDFTLGSNPPAAAAFTIPALNYSAKADGGLGNGSFDLTEVDQFGELITVSGLDPVLTINNDALIEGAEYFNLTLNNLTSVVAVGDVDGDTDIASDTQHIIIDNGQAIITVTPTTVNENNDPNSQTQTFEVVLTTEADSFLGGTSTGPAQIGPGVEISVNVVDLLGANGGDAVTPDDYVYDTQSVTFLETQGLTPQIRTLDITTVNDNIVEPNEAVNIGFDNLETFNTFGSFNQADTQVILVDGDITINDDDDTAEVKIEATLPAADENVPTSGQFKITFDPDNGLTQSSTDTEVTFSLAGDAIRGVDYDLFDADGNSLWKLSSG